jgi:hypothetical protein
MTRVAEYGAVERMLVVSDIEDQVERDLLQEFRAALAVQSVWAQQVQKATSSSRAPTDPEGP